MNQDERKKFWDVLSTMHDMTPAHIQQLQQTIIARIRYADFVQLVKVA